MRLGALVTPVPRRNVAKLAREVSTLDQLSSGRILFWRWCRLRRTP
ncbi:LLM class flavin-dependent oxidoreductase [Rhodococcus sp. (in: high G+C Gram-positive bacteria)]